MNSGQAVKFAVEKQGGGFLSVYLPIPEAIISVKSSVVLHPWL